MKTGELAMVAGGVIGAAALVVFAMFEFAKTPSALTATTAKRITIGPSNAGQTLVINVGDQVVFDLPESSGGAYAITSTGGANLWGTAPATKYTDGGVTYDQTAYTSIMAGQTIFTCTSSTGSFTVTVNAN